MPRRRHVEARSLAAPLACRPVGPADSLDRGAPPSDERVRRTCRPGAPWGVAIRGRGAAAGGVVAENEAVSAERAAEIADAAAEALSADGLELGVAPRAAVARLQLRGFDPAACRGRPDCVAAVAETFGDAVVAALHLSRVGRRIAVRIEAVTSTGRVLADGDFVVGEGRAGAWALRPLMQPFVARLRPALAALLPTPPPPPVPPPPPTAPEPAPVAAAIARAKHPVAQPSRLRLQSARPASGPRSPASSPRGSRSPS